MTKSARTESWPRAARSASGSGLSESTDSLGARPAGHDEEHQRREEQQHAHRDDDAARHVLLGVVGLLGGEWDTLDGEEEPDSVDQRGHDTGDAHREEGAGHRRAVRVDIEKVARREARGQADHGGDQGHHGDCRDAEHQLEGFTDPIEVHSDEHRVGDRVDQPAVGEAEEPQGLDIAADEDGDRGRRDGILDQDGHAGREATDGAQCAPCEAVARACDREGRGHLGQPEHHAGVHDPHQNRGDQQTAPAALIEPEVPPGEVAGDDVADAESREQYPARGSRLQLSVLHVVRIDRLVVHS